MTHPDCHKNPTFQKHFGILILKENQLKQGTSPLPSKLNSSDTSSSTVVCKEPVEVETVFSFEPWGFMPEYSNNGQFEHIDSVWKFFASKRNMEIAWNQNISFLMWSEDGRMIWLAAWVHVKTAHSMLWGSLWKLNSASTGAAIFELRRRTFLLSGHRCSQKQGLGLQQHASCTADGAQSKPNF